ncbi:LOW QUALITY PROTEIN: protein tyrosine phosphatase receptor type C-associated protein [Pelecanus crispus]|uniref:LOW QUALITY PROTEIN: protein tyrosine phosphatase receptor type C-associated protein n=1 Tax=Pelecanus crispus TaxID=36300 RepID=UPI003F5D17CF
MSGGLALCRHGVGAEGPGLLSPSHLQAGAWRRPPAPALLALARLVAAGEPVGNHNDRVVGALVGLLLFLAVGLALAWHRLCQLSAGRYHPRPMGRRALACWLRGRWHRLRGGPAAQPCGDGEVASPQDEEEELMLWSQEQQKEEEEKRNEDEEAEREEEQEEDEEAEAAPEAGESPPAGGAGRWGGSAEALLSDLHAFSGTAAWGDARPHVTAL